jgi:small subunit ribosomal protein S15
MAVTTESKIKNQEIIKKFGKNATDSGSTEVQVALITSRINELNQHFGKFPKDHHSRRGLLKLVGQRRRLLNYIKAKDSKRYNDLIQALELRK